MKLPATNLEELATAVAERWAHVVTGEYRPPPCPTASGLAALLAVSNFAAGYPEEGRYPRFNVTATSANEKLEDVWRFDSPRPLSVSEFRRLIPATDYRKSAVHVQWDEKGEMTIVGIHDLGTSWYRARTGLEYRYDAPPTLLVEVETAESIQHIPRPVPNRDLL